MLINVNQLLPNEFFVLQKFFICRQKSVLSMANAIDTFEVQNLAENITYDILL